MSQARCARYAWAVLGWNILVILWGAVVSSTGSGAGCGDHWPLCQGQVLPRPEALQTVIEFSHRATSGVALVLVLGLVVWAFRAYPRGHRARAGAVTVVVFIILESLVGALLVLQRWVAFDTSLARVFTQPIHLTNTLLLLAALTLTAWWASGGDAIRWRQRKGIAFGIGLVGVIVIGSSGALISLGDLLALALGERYNSLVEWLVSLRLWHPAVAIGIGLYVLAMVVYLPGLRPTPQAQKLAWLTGVLVLAQWAVGFLNVALRVPLWAQLLHLLIADLTWIALVLWAATALAVENNP